MVLISGVKVCVQIITWRRNNGFHFSPKGKNGVQNAICAPGVKIVYLLLWYFVSYCLNLCEDKTIKQSKYHYSFSIKNIRKILQMNFFRQRLSSSLASSSSCAMEESMTHHSQQRRLANPNLVFLKRKNEREKRIMEDNSLIFGFENPSRSLCPITADPDNVKFLGMTF